MMEMKFIVLFAVLISYFEYFCLLMEKMYINCAKQFIFGCETTVTLEIREHQGVQKDKFSRNSPLCLPSI